MLFRACYEAVGILYTPEDCWKANDYWAFQYDAMFLMSVLFTI